MSETSPLFRPPLNPDEFKLPPPSSEEKTHVVKNEPHTPETPKIHGAKGGKTRRNKSRSKSRNRRRKSNRRRRR